MSKSTGKKFAIGAAVAAVVGYVAGILTAPKSGKETRQNIKDAAQQAIVESEKQLKRAHTELTTTLTQARERATKLKGSAREQLEQVMETAKTTKEKARVLLSAVHEGDAEDKDLKKAVQEANKAVEHLKTYLKKET